MPIALDPNETFCYVLSTDRLKPEEERPTLVFYFPTAREVRQIGRAFERAMKDTKNVEEWIEERCNALRIILADWKNFRARDGQPVAFDPEMLDAVLSDGDLTELEARLLKEMALAETDKKKFARSALLNLADSAPPVAAGNAAAPAPPSRSKSNASFATAASTTGAAGDASLAEGPATID